MPVIWNDALRAKLLMAIIKTSGSKVDYKGITDFMGPEFNMRCIQNQIQFIKMKANGTARSAPCTPTKKGTGKPDDAMKTPTNSPASAKRGRKQVTKEAFLDGPEEEDSDADRPAKKVKAEVKTEVKQEIKTEDIA